MSSIVSGYKFATPEEIVESRDGGPELLEAVGMAPPEPRSPSPRS